MTQKTCSVHHYGGSPELHPVLSITETSIIIQEYTGRALYPDGTVEMIGEWKRTRLDRKRLEAGEEISRHNAWYKLVSGDDLLIDGTCTEAFLLADYGATTDAVSVTGVPTGSSPAIVTV
jgi:hypothetical protein